MTTKVSRICECGRGRIACQIRRYFKTRAGTVRVSESYDCRDCAEELAQIYAQGTRVWVIQEDIS